MRDRSTIVFLAVSAVLVALTIFGAVVSILHDGFGANGAAWVQAGGSIATIAGAVWLFRSEVSLRRRERRTAGEELAWAVRFALTNAQFEARSIARELLNWNVTGDGDPKRHWLLQSENCQNVLRVYAERTDHLHPVLNQLASNGMLLLKQLDEEIGKASVYLARREHPPAEIIADIARYEGHFGLLLEMLDARMRGIVLALDEGNDSLPTERLDFWKTGSGG